MQCLARRLSTRVSATSGLNCSRKLLATKASDGGGAPTRPPTAPKLCPDPAEVARNAELHEHNCVERNYRAYIKAPGEIARLVQRARFLGNELRGPQKDINALEKRLVAKNGSIGDENRSALLEKIKEIKAESQKLEEEKSEAETEARRLALSLPNLTYSKTPRGDLPTVLSYINYDPESPGTYNADVAHSEIGTQLSLIDFVSASTTTGWGFYYLLNEAALLEQALIQFTLAVAMRRGWRITSPPSLVYSHIADACGFQPRDQNDEQQIWQVAQTEREQDKPRRSLAATAEIPLAALYASKSIPEADLPLKLVGSSRCYRAEAGARGVDTKGLYRVHEFTKVEMFAWTDSPVRDPHDPEWTSKSTVIFDEMVAIQTEILTSLGLPCRVLEMPASDLGASAYRKIDIEALFPSRMARDDGWGEVTSASICTDYQSRRLNTRILDQDNGRKRFPHTVNGTAMAVPRVLAAILEHGWRAEGYVVVPEVLRSYMGGTDKIGPKMKSKN